jgi:catechol 2,3-dioxygenase-like lactoylglutathione lyase family enzyme
MRNDERPIKALGEIALRVTDLDMMQRFYEDIVGLELMRRTDNAVFFKIAEGYGGHTQVLALFDRSASPGYRGLNAATSTVDHIAFFKTNPTEDDRGRPWTHAFGTRPCISSP